MQIMEGDVIATIQKHKDYISHYHTAGVPGRNEIDETQELYYPAIMKAIADTLDLPQGSTRIYSQTGRCFSLTEKVLKW